MRMKKGRISQFFFAQDYFHHFFNEICLMSRFKTDFFSHYYKKRLLLFPNGYEVLYNNFTLETDTELVGLFLR